MEVAPSSVRATTRHAAARATLGSFLLALILPVTVLVAWQVGSTSGHVSPLLFPSPTTIFEVLVDMASSGTLWEHTAATVVRVVLGLLLGGGLALFFGALVGMYRLAEHTINPTAQMVRMVPHLALTSLFVLWFGIGDTSKVLLIAKGVFFPIYLAAYLGFRDIDVKLVQVTQVLEFRRRDLLRRLLLPGSIGHLFTGLRLSVGIAWGAVVVAEMISSADGLGYMMVDARSFNDTPVIFVGITMFAILGITSDLAIRAVEHRALRWSDRYTG